MDSCTTSRCSRNWWPLRRWCRCLSLRLGWQSSPGDSFSLTFRWDSSWAQFFPWKVQWGHCGRDGLRSKGWTFGPSSFSSISGGLFCKQQHCDEKSRLIVYVACSKVLDQWKESAVHWFLLERKMPFLRDRDERDYVKILETFFVFLQMCTSVFPVFSSGCLQSASYDCLSFLTLSYVWHGAEMYKAQHRVRGD